MIVEDDGGNALTAPGGAASAIVGGLSGGETAAVVIFVLLGVCCAAGCALCVLQGRIKYSSAKGVTHAFIHLPGRFEAPDTPPPPLTAAGQWAWLRGRGWPAPAVGEATSTKEEDLPGPRRVPTAGEMRRWSTPKPKARDGDAGVLISARL